MKYLLDTNICIYLIRKKPRSVLRKFSTHTIGEVGVSTITVAELQFGVQKSRQATRNQQALDQFLIPLTVVDFDYRATQLYGKIRTFLEAQGQPIGPLDTLIAAHALSLNLTLVTNNTKEFQRVPKLKVTNWVVE